MESITVLLAGGLISVEYLYFTEYICLSKASTVGRNCTIRVPNAWPVTNSNTVLLF
jgi:hypothetical protein